MEVCITFPLKFRSFNKLQGVSKKKKLLQLVCLDYPEEEILVGRATLYDCDSFLVAITINGRNMLLNEIKSSHSDKWEKIKRMSNFPVGEWKTLGSEVEIENELIKNSRPFISYDCYIRKDFHEKGFFRGFNCVDYYTELKEEGITMTENVKGVAFHKYAQACPQYQDASAQTVPEIPVNSTTQFSVEMRVMENEENLQQLEVDWEMLNKKFTAFFYKVDMFLTYNEEYDLYRDDYEMLASEGEDISMSPNIPYDHYLTMLTLVGTKGKGITSTSWHPCQPGLIAVAYGKQHVTKVEDLNLNSDEEVVDNDSDEKNVYSNLPTSNQFDEHIENIWKDQLAELENDMKEEKHDTQYYDLAVASIEFMQQAKNIRLFEVIQEKERLHRTPDVEDLYEEEKFVYPLFEGTKKKQKKENEKLESIDDIIDRVMSREPSFLKREHLFSGNFHWKLKMADEVINPLDLLLMKRGGSIPKRYIRTFLFREIWGDSWNFGDDLKYAAIEVNKDFRESALEALGLPTIPDSDILLPGFKGEDIVDYTVELDFSDRTKKILTEELEKLEHGKRSKIIKRQFEELSSCESSHGLFEHSDDEEELDKLNLVHHVAIWSIANDVKPMRRLVSPFEITSLSFCPYDGRFLAGGTSTGQVVLWDLEYQLEHEECLVQERSDFDLLGFKHLERVMCWFKRLRPDKRIYVTALSHKNKSHMDRIVDVTWLPPSKKISPSGKYEEISPEDGFSFQFMSTSADGVMKFWDLTSSPLPLAEPPNNKNAFTRPGIFKLPSNHQKSKSRYSDLFLRWNPVFQVRFELKDSGAIKKYHLTCISHDHVVYTYEKLITNLNKSETNVELQELYGVASVCTDSMNNETLVGTVDGLIILFSWQLPEVVNEKLQLEGLGATIIRQFKPIHDGPISHISRHPNNNNIFLSSGGHVFALWKINQEGPLKWKRYSNCFITAVGWTQFRPSSFRIGRSDGCIEIWDLHEIGSEPSMVLKVTSGPIYDFTVPTLSVPVGIFGITDHRSILKFYCTPWEHQIARPNEAEEFFGRIEAEHERKMSITKKITDDSDKSKIEDLQKIDELVTSEIDFQQKEADIVKKKEIIGCKKFKEELYKWYLRRRGKNAAWLDESEKKWFKNEEEYMIKTILKNKQIDMKQLDTAIEPLYKKEKHELDVAVKILDVLEMADDIFRHAVQELALVRDYSNKSQVSVEIENMNFGDLHEAMEELDLYFGEAYEKTENELEKFVKNHKITKEWTFVELCEKNQYIRDLWNDKRRLLKPEHKWARELIHEELEKAGYKFSYYINHEESYLRKKYKRRIENIEHLKKKFGNDYDPYWDLHDRYASRTKKTDEFTEEVSDIKGKVQYAGGIFNRQAKTTAMVHPQREVNIVLPKGSFYRKYMPNEKNIKWEKPMVYEERVYSRSKMFKDKLGDSEMTVTSEATVMSSTETDLDGTVEPIYDEDDDENVGTSDVKKIESPVKMSETVERSEEISSSTDTESDENEEKAVDNENEKSRASSVRFKEHENIGTFKPQIDDETKKQPTQFIDLEKEDVSDQFHGIDDLRRIVKEKKLKGEEIIDLDTLKKMVKEKKLKGEEIMDIDDLSVSFESITGSLASSSPSPDMSLKSEDLDIEDWYIDEDSEEEFKEYFEGVPPRYDAPKVVPCDDSSFVDEPTEEWMAEALKPAFKPQEVEEEKSDENEEGPKKPDIQTTAILEKEKAVRDKIEKLELMSESSQIMETFTPLDQSGPKIERIKHVFDKRYSEEDDLPE